MNNNNNNKCKLRLLLLLEFKLKKVNMKLQLVTLIGQSLELKLKLMLGHLSPGLELLTTSSLLLTLISDLHQMLDQRDLDQQYYLLFLKVKLQEWQISIQIRVPLVHLILLKVSVSLKKSYLKKKSQN